MRSAVIRFLRHVISGYQKNTGNPSDREQTLHDYENQKIQMTIIYANIGKLRPGDTNS